MYNNLKRTSKKNYYSELLYTYRNDMKKTWRVLNNIMGKNVNKSSINTSFNHNNVQLNDKGQIAHEFCNYFTSVGEKLATNIPPSQYHFSSY